MSRVEELEIQPRPRAPRPLFPRSWRKTGSAILGCLVLSALAPTMTTQVEIKIPNKSDQLFQAALDSPENFEILIADNDFLVDVATRKFDHLNIKEIDDILGTTVSDNQSLWNSP